MWAIRKWQLFNSKLFRMKRGSYFKYQYDESKQMPKTSYYRKIKQEREALNNPIKQESDVDTLVAITNEKITKICFNSKCRKTYNKCQQTIYKQ